MQVKVFDAKNGKPGHNGRPLLNCIKEAVNNANLVYINGSNHCLKTVPLNSYEYRGALDEMSKGAAAAVWNTGTCSISQQYENYTIRGQQGETLSTQETVAFVAPSDHVDKYGNLIDENGKVHKPFRISPDDKNRGMLRDPNYPVNVVETDEHNPNVGVINNVLAPDQKYQYITYEDPKTCNVAARGQPAATSRNGESK